MSEKEVRQKPYAAGYEQGKFDARVEADADGDCISRAGLLKAFGLSDKTRKYGGDHSGYDTMTLYEIQGVIEDAPSSPTWIPCSERLPDNPGAYICSCRWDEDEPFRVDVLEYGNPVNERWKDSERVFPGGYAFGENWGHDGRDEMDNIEEVVAWMPMPEPYKEG